MKSLLNSIVCCVGKPKTVDIPIRNHVKIKSVKAKEDEIVKGGHGYVKKVLIKNKAYARKKYYNRSVFYRELNILKKLGESKYLQNYRFCDELKLRIYSDYEGKDMFNWMESISKDGNLPSISHKYIKIIGKNILLGLEELKNKGYAHLDLKPENIILKEDYSIKIIDFDTARKIHKDRNLNVTPQHRGTENYISPEMLFYRSYSETTDLWSLGVILWILKAGIFPYDSVEEIYLRFDEYNYYEKCIESNENFSDLLKKLFEKNHRRRISIEDALNHPYFEMIN